MPLKSSRKSKSTPDELQTKLQALVKKGPVLTTAGGSIVGADYVCEGSLFLSAGACQMSCTNGCKNALDRCINSEGCIAVDANSDATIATLKKAYRWATVGKHRVGCFKLHLAVLERRKQVDRTLTEFWDRFGCIDYTFGDYWGNDLVVDKEIMNCPPKDAKFIIVTYINKPFSGFCALIKSAMLLNVPITILGWRPAEPKRWHQWYLGSKIVSTLYWADHCALTDNTTIVR
jgi:hypothetical protein